MYEEHVDFGSLLGKTFASIEIGDDKIVFVTEDGEVFEQSHDQDCCESVYVEDVVGDPMDLVGSPILLAEEVASYSDTDSTWPPGKKLPEYEPESYTWVFYKLATVKGYLDIRWYGSSNGYYGETASLKKIK